MPTQKNVNRYPAWGVVGDTVTTYDNPRKDDGGIAGADVTVGRALWLDSNGNYVNTGTGIPVGFATRGLSAFNPLFTSESSMVISEGQSLGVRRFGDMKAISATNAVKDHVVFVNNTTGAISTAAPGSTIAGATETKWVVMERYTGTAGTVIGIEYIGG